MGKLLIFSLIIFANPWIWRIFKSNIIIFIILILITVLLYQYLIKSLSMKWLIIEGFLFLTLFYFQMNTTNFQSLVLLDNDEQRIQKQRLQFYNPSIHYLRVVFYRLNLTNFLEGDFTTAKTRLMRNFFEILDPGVYFFGGHPRQRVWANDFEKFPFILVIPFLIGFYQILLKKDWKIYLLLILSFTILSIIGHKNWLGPFMLFPIFPSAIILGTVKLIRFLKLLPQKLYKPSLVVLLILVMISIIQVFSYAT